MLRLMIVDNEPNIVRGIQQLLTEEAPFELDVYGVFSAEEALQLLNKIKIDIALLDIRMPGMNGLELQTRIAEQWPHCKTIFLSGYDEFTFIQTALRNGSLDYILKTDGDEVIIQAVQKAINALSQAMEAGEWMDQARQKLQKSLGPLQKEYMDQLIKGLTPAKQRHLDELQIPLSVAAPPLLLIAKVDRWDPAHSDSDKALLYYAIQNIANEYWIGCRHFSVMLDSASQITFIQAMPEERWDSIPERWIRYIHGQLESIQAACKMYLRLPVSFIASRQPAEWNDLPVRYNELKQILFFGFGQRTEMLLTDDVRLNFATGQSRNDAALQAHHKLKQLLSSDLTMEGRLWGSFDDLVELSRELTDNKPFLYEIYTGISYLLLSYINQNEMWNEFTSADSFKKLYSLDAHNSWEEAVEYLGSIISLLQEARIQESEAGAHFLVAKLKSHIDHHLDEDLSLVRLAELVYLNPTYLSRLFKQQAGQGVSQYITELRINRARELLKYSQLKIHEIAAKVGFDSASSFGRFFKRETNLTPQDYRENN